MYMYYIYYICVISLHIHTYNSAPPWPNVSFRSLTSTFTILGPRVIFHWGNVQGFSSWISGRPSIRYTKITEVEKSHKILEETNLGGTQFSEEQSVTNNSKKWTVYIQVLQHTEPLKWLRMVQNQDPRPKHLQSSARTTLKNHTRKSHRNFKNLMKLQYLVWLNYKSSGNTKPAFPLAFPSKISGLLIVLIDFFKYDPIQSLPFVLT